MSQTLLEMAKDLVAEQIRTQHVSPDDVKSLLLSTHATLLSLHQAETSPASERASLEPVTRPVAWQRSITKHAVTCLECGNSFRQLSSRHLRIHDLDAKSYRLKYGIPSTQNLSSRQATARRRELAQQIRPWEAAASKRANTEAESMRTARGAKTGRASRRRTSS